MYPNSGATIRADLNSVLEEASKADDFFIGDKVMPNFGVDTKTGTYLKLTKSISELLKPGDTRRERGGSYGQVKRAWTSANYETVDRGLESAVDDTDAKDLSRFFALEAAEARWVLRSMRLSHEKRVKDAIINTTNFAATAAAVDYTEANIATIDLPLDIMAAIERVSDNAEAPNTIILSPAVYNRARRSTLLKSFLVGQNIASANITEASLQQAFAANGITQVLIGRAREDSSVKKTTQTYTAATIWPNTYIWVGKVASGDFMNGGAGRTLTWNAEGGLFVTETYRDEKIRSNMVRVRQHTEEAIIDTSCGTMITTNFA